MVSVWNPLVYSFIIHYNIFFIAQYLPYKFTWPNCLVSANPRNSRHNPKKQFIIDQYDQNIDKYKNKSIPMISISLNYDKDDYLSRLLDSIDHPVDDIYIQVGNADRGIVDAIVKNISLKQIQLPHLNIHVHTMTFNPGSAKGFNFGLKFLLNDHNNSVAKDYHIINDGYGLNMHDKLKLNSVRVHYKDWGIVVNSDIAFMPGVLKYLSYNVYQRLDVDKRFGIGFLNLCCGGEWSAVVFTRDMVSIVGLFDENFYPAYYEDDDYGIRISLSKYQAVRFLRANVTHGTVDGSVRYISGVESILIGKKKQLNPAQQLWKSCFRKGIELSRSYISAKWNIKLAATTIQPVCKSFRGINKQCKVGFDHPFNDSSKGLNYWKLDQDRFDLLLAIGNGSVTIK